MNLIESLRGTIADQLIEEGAASTCQACGNDGLVAFYEANNLPVQTCVLLDEETESIRYPKGDLLLCFCERCGFIQNTRFDPSLVDYSKPTEESQAFSPRFSAFAAGLADELVRRNHLQGRSVLEIGCGKGDFLVLLAERGIGSGVGVDPGFMPNRSEVSAASLSFIRDWYGPAQNGQSADLVLTRHLMEHVANAGEFLGWLADTTRQTPGAVLFTEVPDARRVLAEGAFWDVYYEHCSYFTLGSLARAISATGLRVSRLTTGFDDQYLLAEGVQGSDEPGQSGETPDEMAGLVAEFASVAAKRVRFWGDRIRGIQKRGGSVAVWGGGSKAVAFLSTVDVKDVTVVDINPHKQGKWLPTVGVKVEPPGVLRTIKPDLVIPMNAIYIDEINADLASMSIVADVDAV